MGRVKVGSAPDSWGVWFANDERQTPWERFLDEVAGAGYTRIELGPYGYLPTDPGRLKEELDQRGLEVTAGTIFEHLHRPDSWDSTWADVSAAEYGLKTQFHPHADGHMDSQETVERFLAETDGEHVNLCLDTGHISYCGGDNLELIRKYPERIGYVHQKQVDPVVLAQAQADGIGFDEAVRRGVMCEPPLGVPELPPLLDALAGLDAELFATVEQDLYPCAPDVPLPIAERSLGYLKTHGGGVSV